MARSKGPFTLCAAALILCTVTTINADKCRTGCGGVTPNIFKYQEGATYKYNLDGNIDISLSSAESTPTHTKIRGTVLLSQLGDCNQVLKLQGVQIIGPDAKKFGGLANIEKPIRLNFHDGHIEDEICTEVGDTQNSLNIKRAVASMFQAATKHNHESDVFGNCPTEISSRKDGPMFIIQKSRDLNRCSHREAVKQDFMATSFNYNTGISGSPLVTDYDSEQRLKNGILDYALITENYLYRPFSNGRDHGIKAVVTTKLTFVEETKDHIDSAKATEPKSIHFENPHQETTKGANVDSILNALKETKKTMAVSVSEHSASTFYKLIKILRASKKEDILSVYRQAKTGAGIEDKEGARKVLLDALFRTGTGEAVEVVVELLRNKELSPIEQKLMFLSLAFIRHASKGSLTSAAALLDQADLPNEAYLGIGTLAGHYCKEHNCDNVDELNKLMQKFASKLNAHPANRDAENNVVAMIKGIGNIGHLTDQAVEKLSQIATDKKAPTRLRVAALEAAETDACHAKLTSTAMGLLKNRQEDSEIRIKAYLVVAECPDSKTATALKELLDSEPVYQVGGFIVSHLRNLRNSANPDREHSKQFLSNVHTIKKFPIDPRRFSFNNEISYNFDTLGSGHSVESNVIYSQNSFLPRSVNLNVTTDLLGHSFNLLEIGARQENLDKVLEHYFGPLGVLHSQSPEELYATGKDSLEKIVHHVKERLEKSRGKRDVSKADIDAFAKQIKVLGSELNKNLDLDLSVKIFGSEMMFLSLNEDIHSLTPMAIVDKFFDCLETGLDKAKNFEYHLKNHILFAETEVAYPTSMGFPLKLTFHGTSAMHFITSGQVDLRKMMKDPKNAELTINMIPSANIELSGTFVIDAFFVQTGIKVSNNLLTSTGTDLTVKMLNGKGFDVKLGLPVEKQKLISLEHEIEYVTQEHGKPEVETALKFKDKQREFAVCFDQLSPLIGLTFCGEMNTPSTLMTNQVGFPLNGNSKLLVEIDRDDVKSYHLTALFKDPKPQTKVLEITFETPDSESKRHINLILEASMEPQKLIRATLESPIKTLTAEAVLTDTDSEKSAMVRLLHDKHEYLAKIGVSVKGDAAKQIYEPLIEYSTPNDVIKTKSNRKPDYSVEGQVIAEKNGDKLKYTFDHVKLIAPGQDDIEINGYISKEGPTQYSADLKIARDKINIGTKGKIQFTPENLKLNAEFENSVNPNANFNVKLDLKRADREYDTNLVLIHGSDLSSKKHCLTVVQAAKYKYENKDNFEFGMKNKLTYPLLGIEGKLDATATKKEVKYDLVLAYDKFKLKSELDAKVATKEIGDYDVEFEIEVMNNKLELNAKREIEGEKSKIKNELDISGRKYSVEGTVTHHVKPDDINIGCDLVIKIHDRPDPIKVTSALVSDTKHVDSSAKIVVGSTTTVEIVVKGARAPNPHGNLKIFIVNLLNANGQFKITDGKGSSSIVVDIPKMSRKIKAESTFTCQNPSHNAVVNIYLDFEKDNNNKIHLETNNQITGHSFDSKNTIAYKDHKMEGNAKGSYDRSESGVKMNGEFDLLMPNKHFFAGKLHREMHIDNHVLNGNMKASIEHRVTKDAPARKLEFSAHAADVNMERHIYDLKYEIVATNNDGKNIEADIELKHHHTGEKRNSLYKGKLHGSYLPNAIETEANSEYTLTEGTHLLSASYGPKMSAKVTGKYNAAGGEHPLEGGLDIEIATPNDLCKHFKFSSHGKGKVSKEGDGLIEADGHIESTLNDEKTVKLNAEIKATKKKGEFKSGMTLPNVEPVEIAGSYGYQKTDTGCKCHGDFDLKYGAEKHVKGGVTINHPTKDELDFEFDLKTPAYHTKHINLQLKNKKLSDDKHFSNEVILTADDKKYALAQELVLSNINPSLDVTFTHPDGTVSKIHGKFNRISDKHFSAETNVENIKNFNLIASGDANLESIDNFQITIKADSDMLKLHKIKLEAASKPSKGGKRIQFSAKSGDKNILSGSTNYKANEEGGKFIVEGSGSVKLKEESKTATFKLIKHELDQTKDGEQGLDLLFNAAIANQGIVSEMKISNKMFRIFNSYCEEKKNCAHFEVSSKGKNTELTEFSHELEINVDLRKLGLTHEFGLKAVTNRKHFELDHTVDVHFESSAISKYQYSVYVHPKEAGIQFTTPKRVISLEAKSDVPLEKNTIGPIHAEVAFYMNKKAEPTKKTFLSYNVEQKMDKDNGHMDTKMKFGSPGLKKDFVIQYGVKYNVPERKAEFNMEMDIFAKRDQKIVVTGSSQFEHKDSEYKMMIKGNAASKGLAMNIDVNQIFAVQPTQFHYESKLAYQLGKSKMENKLVAELNPKQVEILARFLNKDLIHLTADLQLSKESQVVDAKATLVGLDEIVSHLEVKNLNTFIYTVSKKSNPANKLQVSSGLILNQIADFRAEIIKGADKHDLIHASVKLDDANFMKPDFGLNTDNIQHMLLAAIQKENAAAVQKFKTIAGDFQTELSAELQQLKDLVKKSVPDMKQSVEFYKKELIALKDELISDKTIQEMSEFMKKIFGTLAATFQDVYENFSKLAEKLMALISKNISTLTDVFTQTILPALKEISDKVMDLYLAIVKDIYELVMIYVTKAAEVLKAHQAELKHIATVISESCQDIGRLFIKFFDQVKEDVMVVFNRVYEQVKALPFFEELKERYNEFIKDLSIPEQFVSVISEFLNTIKDAMPTEELRHFIGVLQDYIAKILNKQALDHQASLKQIYDALMKAFESIIEFVQDKQLAAGADTKNYKNILQNFLPTSIQKLAALPKITMMHFSPLNYLISGDYPSIRQMLINLSFKPKDMIPPFTHHAVLVQGQHIFTFDNRHLTFPGKCDYVLAKDIINGNFTLVGQYKDGHLAGLTFSDKHDTVTIKQDETVTINGAACELPIRHKELEVFRLYRTIHIVSKAGVFIIAEASLETVGIYVNGFYHGQMRGLLGNGNNEPYDDFIQPNGKITEKEAEFGNSYRLKSSCEAVQTVDHHVHHPNPACDSLFGSDSSFRICYPFVAKENFKQACEHGLASGNARTERAIAVAYVAECLHKNIMINMPEKFVQCTNSEKPVALNDQFSVKVPAKSADIVIVVEQDKSNEVIFKELIQPFVTQITNELNTKGISDINFSLIGYGGEYQKYPSHYTQGGKLVFHGKAGNLKFADPEPRKPIDTGCKHLDEVLETLLKVISEVKFQLGMIPAMDAMKEAMIYPFRAEATKAIIFVRAKYVAKFAPAYSLLKYFTPNDGVHVSTIMPLENLKLEKEAKQLKNLVGFNAHSAFTLADAKKKGDGSTELKQDIDYGYNPIVDYMEHHNGNVFLSNNFLQGKGGQKKQFIQVVTHVIADSLVNQEQGLACQCKRNSLFKAQNFCKVVSLKEKESTKKGGVKG